jgi:hypothetical protein
LIWLFEMTKVIETNNWCGIINFNFEILIYYWIQKILLLFIFRLNYGWIRCCIRLMTSMSKKFYCLFVCLFVFFTFLSLTNRTIQIIVMMSQTQLGQSEVKTFTSSSITQDLYHPTTTSCNNINYYHKIYKHIFLSIAYYNYYIIK